MKNDVKLSMTPEAFFALFLKELEQTPEMRGYYKFLEGSSSFAFRRNYFLRRLQYIADHAGEQQNRIWDIGCGYGTTALFLALNGYAVHGTTLESYFSVIKKRVQYWSRHGDVSSFTYSYENLFERSQGQKDYDRIIVQDTLHHIEPIDQGVGIMRDALRPGGRIIVIEENGSNLVQRTMLYLRRGNKRVITIQDETLGREILIGNENIRPYSAWERIFTNGRCAIEHAEYIRLFLPFMWNIIDHRRIEQVEREIYRRNTFVKEYFYYGMNFVVRNAEENA
jgi:2-polyprenyl-3-methyl-5-hydroxy-6-metoxy-1,4-benzoquinol methylase